MRTQKSRNSANPCPAASAGSERRRMVIQELGRQMQLISEEATCSLWASRLEDELPAVLHAAAVSVLPGHYRGVEISPVYAAWLTTLAVELGHWVMPGPGLEYVPYTPRSDRSDRGECKPADSPRDAEPGS